MIKTKHLVILYSAIIILIIISATVYFLDKKQNNQNSENQNLKTYNELREINYIGKKFNVYINVPAEKELDYVLVFHGTTQNDSIINETAEKIGNNIKNVISKDVGIISVAYPQRNMIFQDNIIIPEAALLWVQNQAEKDLNIKIDRTFLIGHSLGGYIVTRLNTMYKTDGVIANAPGPIDLAFTCKVLENIKFGDKTDFCNSMKERYGTAASNPSEYTNQSLISFVSGQKSKILFIQGLNDNKKQVDLMKTFEQKINTCKNCAESNFVWVSGADHGAIIESEEGIKAVNDFLK
jgi:hypothetical protein